MLRRSHKKSRGGYCRCQCDEQRPRCLLCTMSSRECSFASEALAPAEPSPTTHRSPRPSPSWDQNEGQGISRAQSIDDPINLQHTELLIHLTSSRATDVFSLGDGFEPYQATVSRTLGIGLTSPYLLYQLLAFSARHLAYLHPDKRAYHLHQATSLQTRALSLFNAGKVQITASNCVAVCLFSVVLGHHLLTDTLTLALSGSVQPPGCRSSGLDSFLNRYIQCLETHRGVYTVAIGGWSLLMGTELAPVLSRSRAFTSQEPKGDECRQLQALVASSAIRYLQLGFDALSTGENENMRYQMLFLWNVLVPSEFSGLLAKKRAQALVILAYYAFLLHHGRHIWQVGGAGQHILGMIEEYLGPEWSQWLEYLRLGMRFG
ncbi:uncharacterized protein BDW70DRAFT_150415 [Aspergillus foveolatus]|uniref:uncharacterized protein n=1 Tax=Aspergillus foveolatus TaxID=210207 RepID=UPI003CCD0955